MQVLNQHKPTCSVLPEVTVHAACLSSTNTDCQLYYYKDEEGEWRDAQGVSKDIA
jgi:hypothetical protein